MKKARFLSYALLMGLLLALAGSVVVGLAQGQGPPGDVQAAGDLVMAATLSSKFSYQGVLKENGSPVTGSRDMTFRLYADDSCTTQVGSDIVEPGVHVTNGLFSVDLEVTHSDFDGQGLWLEVEVGGTSIGCQEILPVPYALSLRPGATISGTLPVLTARGEDALGQLARLEVLNITPFTYASVGAYGEGDWGVYGYSPEKIGVRGKSAGTSGTGVYGFAQAISGETYGVQGKAQSPNGYGGYFENAATSGTCYGVYGATESSEGTGVYGHSPYHGVGGGSNDGVGVYGWSNSLYGVYGTSGGTSGHGVHGFASSLNGGHGVYAESNGSGAGGAALWAEAKGTDGIAIWAEATGSDSTVVLEHNAGQGDFVRAFETGDSELRFRLKANGWGYADGGWTTPAVDLAEMLPAVEGLEPGDVLVIGPDGKLIRSSQPYATNVVGVYSTKPGFVGGSDEDGVNAGKVPLALVGVVPVKASSENGSIAPGDLLVASSISGHAMKAGPNPAVGTVIGKAWEGLEGGIGVIEMLVMLQ